MSLRRKQRGEFTVGFTDDPTVRVQRLLCRGEHLSFVISENVSELSEGHVEAHLLDDSLHLVLDLLDLLEAYTLYLESSL